MVRKNISRNVLVKILKQISFRVEKYVKIIEAGLAVEIYVKCFGSLQCGDLYLIYSSRGSNLRSDIVYFCFLVLLCIV